MLRIIGAVIAGYATMVALVMAATVTWVSARVPGGLKAMRARMRGGDVSEFPAPTAAYYVGNIAFSFAAAAVGGWVTERLSSVAPQRGLMALCALVLVMGVGSAFSKQGAGQPAWYRFLIPLVGVAGIAANLVIP